MRVTGEDSGTRNGAGADDHTREATAPDATVVLETLEATVSLYHRMRAFADDIHEELGVSGAMRGVLREIDRLGPQTVPAMARRRPVSRQHIQVLVNQLHDLGLIEMVPNPHHKRSKVVKLTDYGQQMVNTIWTNEVDVFESTEIPIQRDDLEAAIETLRVLRRAMENKQRQWSVANRRHKETASVSSSSVPDGVPKYSDSQ